MRTGVLATVDGLDLRPAAFRLYVHVLAEDGVCRHSPKELASKFRVTERTIIDARAELATLGLVGVQAEHAATGGRASHILHLAGMKVEPTGLTVANARRIRAQYATGKFTHKVLAWTYGISIATVSRVLRNLAMHDPSYTPLPPRRGGRRKKLVC